MRLGRMNAKTGRIEYARIQSVSWIPSQVNPWCFKWMDSKEDGTHFDSDVANQIRFVLSNKYHEQIILFEV
jgi:hypothetical protein